MYKTLLLFSLILNLLVLAAGVFLVQRYGGLRQVMYKFKNPGVRNLYLHRQNMFEEFPAKPGAIVFLGNSLTAQGDWAELFGRNDILNRGIPGDHCDGIRQRLPAVLKSNPSKIFLMIGINDLAYHSPQVVLNKYEQLVDSLLAQYPPIRLFLQSVLPVNNKDFLTPVRNSDILSLNAGIQQLAKTKGLTFIDLYPLLINAEGNLDTQYTQDGLHLNGRAYLKWKAVLEPYLTD